MMSHLSKISLVFIGLLATTGTPTKRESCIHDSVQAFSLDKVNETVVASPVDFLATVEVEMEPMVVPHIAFLMMNVTPFTISLNEEEEVKFALSIAIAKDYFKNNMVSATMVFGARLATAIPFDMAVVSLEEFKRKFLARGSGLARWIGRYRLGRNGGNTVDLSGFVVWLPLMMQPAIAIMAAAILAWIVLSMVTMTICAFKLIVQKVLAFAELAASEVDRFDGNNLLRVLALPMSETYLQIVSRAPRTLAIRNNCRDMVPSSSTALVVRASRILAIFNDCHDLIVRAAGTLAIYNPCRDLVVIASRALTIYNPCRALVLFASRALAIYNGCRDSVSVVTTLVVQAPRSLAKYNCCRALVVKVVVPRTLAIYTATLDMLEVRLAEFTAENNDNASIPAPVVEEVPQEDNYVMKFLRMLVGAQRAVVRELIDIIVGKVNEIFAHLFPIVEHEEAVQEEDSFPEVEEEKVEPEKTEPEQAEKPAIDERFRHRHTVLGKIKRKRAKKLLQQRVQEWQGFS